MAKDLCSPWIIVEITPGNMVSVEKIVSPSMVVEQQLGKVHVSCQDVNFREIQDLKRICETVDDIP